LSSRAIRNILKRYEDEIKIFILALIIISGIIVVAIRDKKEVILPEELIIQENEFVEKTLSVNTESMHNPQLEGFFEVIVGFDKTINVVVFDRCSYLNWKNRRDLRAYNTSIDKLYDSGVVTANEFDIQIENGTHYIIFNNTFSNNPKTVTTFVELTYIHAISGIPWTDLYILGGIIILISYYYVVISKPGGSIRALIATRNGESANQLTFTPYLFIIAFMTIFSISWFIALDWIDFIVKASATFVALVELVKKQSSS